MHLRCQFRPWRAAQTPNRSVGHDERAEDPIADVDVHTSPTHRTPRPYQPSARRLDTLRQPPPIPPGARCANTRPSRQQDGQALAAAHQVGASVVNADPPLTGRELQAGPHHWVLTAQTTSVGKTVRTLAATIAGHKPRLIRLAEVYALCQPRMCVARATARWRLWHHGTAHNPGRLSWDQRARRSDFVRLKCSIRNRHYRDDAYPWLISFIKRRQPSAFC